MRRIRLFLALSLMLPMIALAADTTPPNLEPLPDIPPPPRLGVDSGDVD
jgi:hypothetical protein